MKSRNAFALVSVFTVVRQIATLWQSVRFRLRHVHDRHQSTEHKKQREKQSERNDQT